MDFTEQTILNKMQPFSQPLKNLLIINFRPQIEKEMMQTPEQQFGSPILPKMIILNRVQMKIHRITAIL